MIDLETIKLGDIIKRNDRDEIYVYLCREDTTDEMYNFYHMDIKTNTIVSTSSNHLYTIIPAITFNKLGGIPRLKQWVAALRNGNYNQTKGFLKLEDGFCCLGVYLDIIDHGGWDPLDNQIKRELRYYYKNGINFYTEVGDEELPREINYHNINTFVVLNDDGIEFSVIADILEFLYEDAGEELTCLV